ncbi:MAG TPA: DNA repair exonuclease [Thermoanaerobaculia bacterium]
MSQGRDPRIVDYGVLIARSQRSVPLFAPQEQVPPVTLSLVSSRRIRVLLIADTHLGFDLPERPRSDRRRRGEDFFSAFERALQPAFRGEVDFVVHGGDVFFRSRVKPGLVMRAFEPLKRIADSGVPVLVVPGNHERSAIPYPILAAHPRIHLFDRPRTISLNIRGVDVAVAGFPCERHEVRDTFARLVERTGWRSVPSDLRLLCFHQTVEGATVGPVGYVFRTNADAIPGRAIPHGFAAVLAGHIHRHQLLTADLSGRSIGAPVFYPGSTEPTSAAERGEVKGYVTLELEPDADGKGCIRAWAFHALRTESLRRTRSPLCLSASSASLW